MEIASDILTFKVKMINIGNKPYNYFELEELLVDLKKGKVKIHTKHLKDWLLQHNVIKPTLFEKNIYKRGRNYNKFCEKLLKTNYGID